MEDVEKDVEKDKTPGLTDIIAAKNKGGRPPKAVATETEPAVIKNPCQKHPDAEAVYYGHCPVCFDKLPKMEKRRLYLKARITGVNAHEYPLDLRRAWNQELILIQAGVWKKPLKASSKSKLVGQVD